MTSDGKQRFFMQVYDRATGVVYPSEGAAALAVLHFTRLVEWLHDGHVAPWASVEPYAQPGNTVVHVVGLPERGGAA